MDRHLARPTRHSDRSGTHSPDPSTTWSANEFGCSHLAPRRWFSVRAFGRPLPSPCPVRRAHGRPISRRRYLYHTSVRASPCCNLGSGYRTHRSLAPRCMARRGSAPSGQPPWSGPILDPASSQRLAPERQRTSWRPPRLLSLRPFLRWLRLPRRRPCPVSVPPGHSPLSPAPCAAPESSASPLPGRIHFQREARVPGSSALCLSRRWSRPGSQAITLWFSDGPISACSSRRRHSTRLSHHMVRLLYAVSQPQLYGHHFPYGSL